MTDDGFLAATTGYERWLESYCTPVREGLADKHQRMAEQDVRLLRGAYYRWPLWFAALPPEVRSAPEVLGVGDIHIENFGTWRDIEGRLVWGVNDFDEADEVAFTSDLVRLATSAALEAPDLRMEPSDAVASVLTGYRKGLRDGPRPYVLEERFGWLRDVAVILGKEAAQEWEKIKAAPQVEPDQVPGDAKSALDSQLPQGVTQVEYRTRQAGLGGRGRPRFIVMAQWRGGPVAREAKAAVPPATRMSDEVLADVTAKGSRLNGVPTRAADPYLVFLPRWTVRRLTPDATKIRLRDIKLAEDRPRLLRAMGRDLANLHLGTRDGAVLRDWLDAQPADWLWQSVTALGPAIAEDFAQAQGLVARSI